MENKENPGNKNQKDKKKITWKRVVDWILQILVWLGGILLLYVDVYEYDSYLESYYLTGFIGGMLYSNFVLLIFVLYVIKKMILRSFKK